MDGKTCTFFGHRDCPSTVRQKLREVLVELIDRDRVDTFYVGNNGAFDRITRSVLRELTQEYPTIRYAVVLERLPTEREKQKVGDFSDTMLPEGMENVPPRFAVSRRNQWMLSRSDYVVTYVLCSAGGAAQFAKKAERQKKTVINLAIL